MSTVNLDYYIEYESAPPEGFIAGMEQMLKDNYLFHLNSYSTHQYMKKDVTSYIQEYWPAYPLGSVIVDSLGLYNVNITVTMQDQIDDTNYECDYFDDQTDATTWEAIAEECVVEAPVTTEDILYGPINPHR